MKKHGSKTVITLIGLTLVFLILESGAATDSLNLAAAEEAAGSDTTVNSDSNVSEKNLPAAEYNPEAEQPASVERVDSPENSDSTESTGGGAETVQPSDNSSVKEQGSSDAATLAVECKGVGVCREKMTHLPFRVLPRSFSNVYKNKEAIPDNIAVENVRAFYPLYVYARDDLDLSDPADPKGWYQVSRSVQEPPIGWMQARDVVEWKQALIVSYTHHGTGDEERRRVLMFKERGELEQVLESEMREQMVILLYKNIEEGRVPPAVVSKEPERFVDISSNFYLLPIVDFKTADVEGDIARYLQIAAAVPSKRGADTLEDTGYRREALEKGKLEGEAASALTVDLVFVMDMTRSMQPFIDGTKKALAELARKISNADVKQKVRFGLIGYRDDIKKVKALEYTAKNYTPDLVDVDRFVELLEKEAKVTSIGSVDYAEEAYAGIELGLKAAWNPNSLRFIYLVGDASSHEVGHEQNTTGKDANILRLAAKDANVHILALHLLDPRMPSDHNLARKQFSVLSKIEGSEESALVQIQTSERQSFTAAVENSAGVIFRTITRAQSRATIPSEGQADNDSADSKEGAAGKARKKMEKLMASALIEYLGKEANPPKDIIVWTLDRDLKDPAVRSLEVNVLVNKEQLSDLISSIDRILKAMARVQVSQMQFFEALQGLASQTMKDPESIDSAGQLADSGLLPAYIASLPYKSEILSLTDQMYASMTAEERSVLESSLRAKLQQYRDINEAVDGWIRLNETDPESSKVYPMNLDYLP